jgi:hypothetical protein
MPLSRNATRHLLRWIKIDAHATGAHCFEVFARKLPRPGRAGWARMASGIRIRPERRS